MISYVAKHVIKDLDQSPHCCGCGSLEQHLLPEMLFGRCICGWCWVGCGLAAMVAETEGF